MQWKSLAGFGALILLGLAICGGYVFVADKFCPVESLSTHSPPVHPIWQYYDYKEEQRSASRTHSGSSHKSDAENLSSGNLAQAPAPETKRQDEAADKPNKSHRWIVKFFCEAKAADIALVFFTWCLVIATLWLGWATLKLWAAGEKQIAVARSTADSAERQVRIMAAVEGPMPLLVQIKLVQYSQIPGEVVVADPFPPGPLQANCRILFAVENKGRTPLRMQEICIEKFSGNSLPSEPSYVHKAPWLLVLEKGPIWIRAEDAQIVITPFDVGQATAAYGNVGAFWIFGYFAYLDLLGERREHKFLARWDLNAGLVADNRAGYM